MERVLGIDIGGANVKAATADGQALSFAFALWKHPERLVELLREAAAELPAERVAVTMTGELCDCFATKRDGVAQILAAVEAAFAGRDVGVWSTTGNFLTPAEALGRPLDVAAANWHALATYLGSWTPNGFTLLVDIGSTTCDVVPIVEGRPATQGRTDPDRMRHGELIYTGVRRTPVCAILGLSHAAELFATTHDVYLLLGEIAEDPRDRDTADSRPATIACAHARLARMACDDREGMSLASARELAGRVRDLQVARLAAAVRACALRVGCTPSLCCASGSGEFLVPTVLAAADLRDVPPVSLAQRLGQDVSTAACAYAVAHLLDKTPPNLRP